MTSFVKKYVNPLKRNPLTAAPASNAYVAQARRMLLHADDEMEDIAMFKPRYIRLLNMNSNIGIQPKTSFAQYGFYPMYYIDPFKKRYDALMNRGKYGIDLAHSKFFHIGKNNDFWEVEPDGKQDAHVED